MHIWIKLILALKSQICSQSKLRNSLLVTNKIFLFSLASGKMFDFDFIFGLYWRNCIKEWKQAQSFFGFHYLIDFLLSVWCSMVKSMVFCLWKHVIQIINRANNSSKQKNQMNTQLWNNQGLVDIKFIRNKLPQNPFNILLN